MNDESHRAARAAAAKLRQNGVVNLLSLDAADADNGTLPKLQPVAVEKGKGK